MFNAVVLAYSGDTYS